MPAPTRQGRDRAALTEIPINVPVARARRSSRLSANALVNYTEGNDEDDRVLTNTHPPAKRQKVALDRGDENADSADEEDEEDSEDDEEGFELGAAIDAEEYWEEEQREKEEAVSTLTRSTKQQRKKGEASKKEIATEEYRRQYLPHLEPYDPIKHRGMFKLDTRDPASFKVLANGDPRDVWTPFKEAAVGSSSGSELRSATFRSLRRIVRGYRAEVERCEAERSDGEENPVSVIGQSKHQVIANLPQNWHHSIFDSMKSTTKRVLGANKFDIEHTKFMAGWTAEDLEGPANYTGWIVYKDGSIASYSGSATSAQGAGTRVIGNYERGMRFYQAGIMHPFLASSGLLRHAAKPDVERVVLRPMQTGQYPSNPDAKVKMQKDFRLSESVFVDLNQTMSNDSTDLMMNPLITIVTKSSSVDYSRPNMLDFSQSLQPLDRTLEYNGLNKMYPLAWSGFLVSQKVAGARALERLKAWERQDRCCGACGNEISTDMIDRHEVHANPLYGQVDWLEAELMCHNCHHWYYITHKDGPHPERHEQALQCTSVEEYQLLRNRAWHVQYGSIASSQTCLLCDITLTVPDRSGDWKELVTDRVRVPVLMKDCKCFASGRLVCDSCHNKLKMLLPTYSHIYDIRNDKRAIEAGYDDIYERMQDGSCDLAEVRECFGSWRAWHSDDCPLCQRAYKKRPQPEKGKREPRVPYNGRCFLSKPPAVAPVARNWPCFQGVTSLCCACNTALSRLNERAKNSAVKQRVLDEMEAGETMDYLRDYLEENFPGWGQIRS